VIFEVVESISEVCCDFPKLYTGHRCMLIVTPLLKVWNGSDFNQKTCGDHI